MSAKKPPALSWNVLRSSTNSRSPLLSGTGLISTIFCVHVQQRLIQVPAKPDRLHAVEFPWLEVAFLYQTSLAPLALRDLFLRFLDQDAVVAVAVFLFPLGSSDRSPPNPDIRGAAAPTPACGMCSSARCTSSAATAQSPATTATFRTNRRPVLRRESGADTSSDRRAAARDSLACQVQVVPAAFGLESLQLEVQPVKVEESHVPRGQVGLVGRRLRIAADDAASTSSPGSSDTS